MSLLKINCILFIRLGKTDLHVLLNDAELPTHTYIAFGKKDVLKGLANGNLNWDTHGKSKIAQISLQPIFSNNKKIYDEMDLSIRMQTGERNEFRINEQRTNPVPLWRDSVAKLDRDKLFKELHAYIVLLRDENDEYHARFVAAVNSLPQAILNKFPEEMKEKPENSKIARRILKIDLKDQGGVILENPTVARIMNALKSNHNVILYGPPGTGKTWLMKSVQECFLKGIEPVLFDTEDLDHPFKQSPVKSFPEGKTDKQSLFMTFHQSMSYESFVAGLRPDIDSSSGSITYKVKSGPFIELAENAAKEKGASLLLIDEINRGNTAEIFGELITVLEADKRNGQDGNATNSTVEVRLPYPPQDSSVCSKDGMFSMPYHFYTLASMNSVDRSVAPLDSALRRRFHIIEIAPDIELLKLQARIVQESLSPDAHEEWKKVCHLACKFLEIINRNIAVFRGSDFRLGHAYFWKVFAPDTGDVKARTEALISAFREKVIPQLKEMFRDQQELLRAILGGGDNEGKGELFVFDSGTEIQLENLFVEPNGWLQINENLNDDGYLKAMRIIAGITENELPKEEDSSEEEGATEEGSDSGEDTNEN